MSNRRKADRWMARKAARLGMGIGGWGHPLRVSDPPPPPAGEEETGDGEILVGMS
ncbi:MAG: hypothetical protein JXB30_13065 [Anaerolineae bacterium]|nr:hypothetical protein [Anaerolineae bacterium]